mmetsp:Transcript_26481/g.69609  ORF Transcript_26481/g.69609 Transcript_26481/m.69609 type:complete len:298 (-) Transcript_26481:999-1892(-)
MTFRFSLLPSWLDHHEQIHVGGHLQLARDALVRQRPVTRAFASQKLKGGTDLWPCTCRLCHFHDHRLHSSVLSIRHVSLLVRSVDPPRRAILRGLVHHPTFATRQQIDCTHCVDAIISRHTLLFTNVTSQDHHTLGLLDVVLSLLDLRLVIWLAVIAPVLPLLQGQRLVAQQPPHRVRTRIVGLQQSATVVALEAAPVQTVAVQELQSIGAGFHCFLALHARLAFVAYRPLLCQIAARRAQIVESLILELSFFVHHEALLEGTPTLEARETLRVKLVALVTGDDRGPQSFLAPAAAA